MYMLYFQTDGNGKHQKGHWGYCDEGTGDCPIPGKKEIDDVIQAVGKHILLISPSNNPEKRNTLYYSLCEEEHNINYQN